jgi:hypothetical protein
MRTPSIVRHDAERDTYLVLDDLGGEVSSKEEGRSTDKEMRIFLSVVSWKVHAKPQFSTFVMQTIVFGSTKG